MAHPRSLPSRPRFRAGVRAALFGALAALLAGCGGDGINVRGFVLPEGDPARGEAAFVELGCTGCHTVAGTELGQPDDAPYTVALGGKVIQVKHYGDLLTSIVNPNHRVRPPYAQPDQEEVTSPMPDFTATLTVEQLIDLVAFLHGKYEKLPNYGGKYYYYP